MSSQEKSHSLWHNLPFITSIVSVWQGWRAEQKAPRYQLAAMQDDSTELPYYPLDMRFLLTLPLGTLDEVGVPYNAPTGKYPSAYHPTTIAQYALAHWNIYLATGNEKHKQAFLIQANWLVANESRFADDRGGWPIPFALPEYFTSEPWLSAMTQGEGISVLVRAYRLTGEEIFLNVASRAIRTFELDIRYGGVCASIDGDGIFFEEVGAYPAAHILNGSLFALFGLYDYVALTNDPRITELIKRNLKTFHALIDAFDNGYWSRYDLLYKRPATQFYHSLHVLQLKALVRYSGCEHCAALAARWARYQQKFMCQLRYFIDSRVIRSGFISCWIARYRSGLSDNLSFILNRS